VTAKPRLRARMAERIRHRLAPHLRLLFEEAGLAASATERAAEVPEPTGQVIRLDYPVDSVPRWGHGRPAHPQLYERINRHRDSYADLLTQFLKFTDNFLDIPVEETGRPEQPCWRNGWLPGLDLVSLYSLLALTNPKRYVEVGSGNSTRTARLAIREHGLRTTITSVDPQPRAEIDALCDQVIREPLEQTSLTIFGELEPGDILFIDGSHRTLMNSDATVLLLDVLPVLVPGVLVEVHDVLLPWDYPPEWAERFYSEQYLLAAYLLANEPPFKVVLPNAFISMDSELAARLQPLWSHAELAGVETHGGSFWLEKT
jgi:hypothetical protein